MSSENNGHYKTEEFLEIQSHHNEPIRNRSLYRSVSHDERYISKEKYKYKKGKNLDRTEELFCRNSKKLSHSSREYHSKALIHYNLDTSFCNEEFHRSKLLPFQSAFYENVGPKYQLVLMIQMELCTENLQVWLRKRNEDISDFSVSGDDENFIFREILHGVEYIHSQNIVHRDLKPSNIFLNLHDKHIKIGDFGLAKFEIDENNDADFVAPVPRRSRNTAGVGTRIYMSPEQLVSSVYDQKSDMFSLGIILTELFHPFGTEMERAKCLADVRKGCIPNTLITIWPLQAKLISQLTSKNPVDRPSAKTILTSLLPEKQNDELQRLEQELTIIKEENKSLRNSLSDKDFSSSDLHERSSSFDDSEEFVAGQEDNSVSYMQEIKKLKQQLFARERELKQKDNIIKEKDELIKKLKSDMENCKLN